MATTDLLQKQVGERPIIYAYSDTRFPGMLKVGFTARSIEVRMKEHYPTLVPGQSWKVKLIRPAMRKDGSVFSDKAVHRVLRGANIQNPEGEWFRCSTHEVERAIEAVKNNETTMLQRTQDFKMRPEQEEAVTKTADYFESFAADKSNEGLTAHFLWNAKMRFGKTFTAYQLALRMKWKHVLVLTFKPAVKTAWKEDLLTHKDFKGWTFVEKQENREFNHVDLSQRFVCFASFQDVLGTNSVGGIKATNEWIQQVHWDCIILDEYHFGAWGKNAKEYYNKQDIATRIAEETQKIYAEDAASKKEMEARETFDEGLMPLETKHYLYLSGTPFRAIASGEFIEEQIYNWTYSDEQSAKYNWDNSKGANPYLSLPKMVMMTYQLPDKIREIAEGGEFCEFDLNEFFSADDETFINEEYVQKWVDLIHGAYAENVVSDLKLQDKKPPFPFSDTRLLDYLRHTFWFLPTVASCKAMKKLLEKPVNRKFFGRYKIIVAAGNEAGMGAEAVNPVYASMGNPQEDCTITLSCGKLSTGVTVKPWTGIFMLRNSSSPETYFQAAFRVQSPWTMRDEWGEEVVLKPLCYVFDFAPNRALHQVADYSCRLSVDEHNPEKKVNDFIQYLPILAYDGSSMKQIDAAGILDMAMSGTTATLLARRWESALLVNVDNATLNRLLASDEAMKALMNIEGFRALNKDIETIINKSEAIKKAKKERGDDLTAKEKKVLTAEEKECKSKRKEIQQKLIKFATRIPVFMYLTDYREYTLYDVIHQLEPELFRKVTGLTLQDFDLLVSLGVFNRELMNDAVYKFKRYEDASLVYTGINTHEGENVGGFDTVISEQTYKSQIPQLEITSKSSTSEMREEKEVLLDEEENASMEKEDKAPWFSYTAGDRVTHKSFGEGVITSIDDKYIMIQFATSEKKFLFPHCFEKGYIS
ncbi:MAG: GIY-YIG nuclease family protein [Segatella copri]